MDLFLRELPWLLEQADTNVWRPNEGDLIQALTFTHHALQASVLPLVKWE